MGEYSGSSPMGDGRNVAGSKYSGDAKEGKVEINNCLLYTSPSPRDGLLSRMPSSA